MCTLSSFTQSVGGGGKRLLHFGTFFAGVLCPVVRTRPRDAQWISQQTVQAQTSCSVGLSSFSKRPTKLVNWWTLKWRLKIGTQTSRAERGLSGSRCDGGRQVAQQGLESKERVSVLTRRLDASARVERESWNHANNDVGRPPFWVQISDPKTGPHHNILLCQNLDTKMESTRCDVFGAGALSKNGANKSAELHRHALAVPAPPLFARRAGCCSQLRIFANSTSPKRSTRLQGPGFTRRDPAAPRI